MARGTNKLSAVAVSKASKPGLYADGLGLYLQVSQWGTKSWLFRFMRGGQARKMGLGPVHTVSLKEARESALECRKLIRDGLDPIEARRGKIAAVRAEAARQMTFRQCAEKYIAAHSSTWKNEKHRAQWPSTLETYAYPVLGDLSVDAIEVAHVLKVLEPIWHEKPETASRVRGRVETVLDWATARGLRKGENPARWKGHLSKLLPARSKVAKVEHHAALPYAELPAFMADLRGMEGQSPRALEFLILTLTRTGETVGARWPEINMQEKMWTIPGERMKGGREHRVPLCDRAIQILNELPREGDFVFIGGKIGTHLSDMALLMTLRRMGRADITVHGFRSTFSDWAAETTAYPQDLREMALAHAIDNKVEAAYRRGDQLEKRRRLMDDWAGYCASPSRGRDNVVNLIARAS
jgi:integrase